MLTIQIQIFQESQLESLRYSLTQEQVNALAIPPAPPHFDTWDFHDWEMRVERARKLAEYIASDVAHKIIDVLNPKATT